MKKYLKPIVGIEISDLEGSLLIKQTTPKDEQGSDDIFINQGGFDDDLFDKYEKPGKIWDDYEDGV